MTRAVPWLLLGLLLFFTFYLAFLLVNAGVALDDARSEVERLGERSALTLSILRKDWVGREAAKVAALAAELSRTGVIVGTEKSEFTVGDIIFEIRDGVVRGVRYFD